MFPIQPGPSFPVRLLEIIAARVERLERAQVLSQSLIHTLLERLESRLGPGFVSDELKLSATAELSDARDLASEVDRLIAEGQQPKAVRLIRESLGITWDQAHAFTNCWRTTKSEDRLRWIQLGKWIKAFENAPREVNAESC